LFTDLLSDLLTPWLTLVAILIPLIYAEKWIHSHLYGVGWLLTNDNRSATALYYIILFPGVFVHEFTQWLVAGALNVPTRRVMAWPEAQNDGTLRLDFVKIKETDWVRSAIIGATPLIAGIVLILLISNGILNLEEFLAAINAGEITSVGEALQRLGSTPDFYLWLYLMFAISNAMLPTRADRKGWPLLIGILAIIIVFLILIGSGDVLLETYTGPITHALNLMETAFATVLAVELCAILGIGFVEEILERLTKRKFQYHPVEEVVVEEEVRQPGSNLPLPPGAPLPSIYNLRLPVPEASKQNVLKSRRRVAAPSPAARPVLGEAGTRPSLGEPKPGDEETTGFRRPMAPAAEKQPVSPLARTVGEEKPDTEEQSRDFRRPDTPIDQRPVSPVARPPRPGAEDETPDEEERPAVPRRPGMVAEQRPATPSARPASPFARPSRPGAEDETPDEEERPAVPRRPGTAAEQHPTTPSARPTNPLARPSRPELDDEEQLTPGVRRPSSPTGRQLTSRLIDDDDEDDTLDENENNGDDVEYIDIDDL